MKTTDMVLAACGVALLKVLISPDWPTVAAFIVLIGAYSFIVKKVAEDTQMRLEKMDRQIEEVRIKTAETSAISSEALRVTQEAKKLISEHNIAMGFTQFRTRAQRQAQGGV